MINYLLERPDINTTHAHISDEACEECHYSGDPQWVQVSETAGHQFHAEEQNIACHTGRHSCFFLRLEADKWTAVDPVLQDPATIYK